MFSPVFKTVRAALRAGLAASILALTAAGATQAAPIALTSVMGSPIEGTWKTQNGTEVTIAPCPSGFCGTLSFIVIPPENTADCEKDRAAFAVAMMDFRNPDKALQSRSLLGLKILDVTPTADPTSFNGAVYNVQDGSMNNVQLFVLDGGTTLRIGGGCVGTICVQSFDWPKVATRAVTPDFACRPE